MFRPLSACVVRNTDSAYLIGYLIKALKNASVAFVKGADERNEFFEKNIQTAMYDEQVRTNKAKDY